MDDGGDVVDRYLLEGLSHALCNHIAMSSLTSNDQAKSNDACRLLLLHDRLYEHGYFKSSRHTNGVDLNVWIELAKFLLGVFH